MENQYFEGLSQKIIQINEYLDSIPDENLGGIFIDMRYSSVDINLQQLGLKFKKDFHLIRIKDEELNSLLKSITAEEMGLFFTISAEQRAQMIINLKNLSFYIKDLGEIYDYQKESSFDLPNSVSENFKFTYQQFIYLINVAKISLNTLQNKISTEINPKFDSKNKEVDLLINDLNLYKGEASARKTKEIYKKKYTDYKKVVEVYEIYIMLLVCLSVTLVLGQLFAHSFFDSLNVSNAVMIKLTILALIATLFTYCFKQIGFYRKISEQAHQTYMELEAFPEFLIHLPKEKQHEIRADLAKRYFGQNLFDSIKEDNVSIQEQAKANAEVLKSTSALLDVIKKQNSHS